MMVSWLSSHLIKYTYTVHQDIATRSLLHCHYCQWGRGFLEIKSPLRLQSDRGTRSKAAGETNIQCRCGFMLNWRIHTLKRTVRSTIYTLSSAVNRIAWSYARPRNGKTWRLGDSTLRSARQLNIVLVSLHHLPFDPGLRTPHGGREPYVSSPFILH